MERNDPFHYIVSIPLLCLFHSFVHSITAYQTNYFRENEIDELIGDSILLTNQIFFSIPHNKPFRFTLIFACQTLPL
ncbi:hypothetical protein HanRHA438_Chr10g0436031 [Helianthus annuus]|nr:hypothetical protein HanRHA438_Chr10g0436031 [Helianthus annuus]